MFWDIGDSGGIAFSYVRYIFFGKIIFQLDFSIPEQFHLLQSSPKKAPASINTLGLLEGRNIQALKDISNQYLCF